MQGSRCKFSDGKLTCSYFHIVHSIPFPNKQPGGVPVLQLKEILYAAGFIGEGLRTVAQVDGAVQLPVRFHQVGRHGEGVPEVMERKHSPDKSWRIRLFPPPGIEGNRNY